MKILLMVLLACLATNTFAQATQVGKITKLFVLNAPTGGDDAQRVIVRLEGDVPPGGLCPKKDYWQLLLKNEAEKAQYALLLASYMNGKSVKIWGNPDAHCIHKGERIRNVEIAP